MKPLTKDQMGVFWSRVNKTQTCWLWTGARWLDQMRYARIKFNGQDMKAHRVSWIMENGEIPEGLCVCHHCDNPICVRPEHLFLATNAENQYDCNLKGRRARGERHGSRSHQGLCRGTLNPSAKLTENEVRQIRAVFAQYNIRKSDLGAIYGVTGAQVGHILSGKTWKHLRG